MKAVFIASCAAAIVALAAARAQAASTRASARAAPTPPPVQENGERAAQARMPQSKAPTWAVLRKTRIGEDSVKGVFTAAFPPEVKAMDRQPISLTGFMLPLDTTAKSSHFLLSKYTPVCFFCPPGEPNEVVEVFSKTGIAISSKMINVSGRFALINDAEKGLFFKIDQAVVQ